MSLRDGVRRLRLIFRELNSVRMIGIWESPLIRVGHIYVVLLDNHQRKTKEVCDLLHKTEISD